jgi:hypothetical protein
MYISLLNFQEIPIPSLHSSFFKNYSFSPSRYLIFIYSVLLVRAQHATKWAASFIFDKNETLIQISYSFVALNTAAVCYDVAGLYTLELIHRLLTEAANNKYLQGVKMFVGNTKSLRWQNFFSL